LSTDNLRRKSIMEDSQPNSESEIRSLYQNLLAAWNRRSAEDFTSLFTEDGNVVGFDGSMNNGRSEIESDLRRIFADHQPAAFVGKVRAVRFLAPEVAVLRAVAGMVPPGKSDIKPEVNAIQTLVTVAQDGRWSIAVFQNTPAAFHGRPELSEALTEELREVFRSEGCAQ
jgi:uncharacterized protein (TIGR02246 family)